MNENFSRTPITNDISNKKNKNPIIRVIKLVIWLVIICIIILYYSYSNFKTNSLIKEKTIINIEKGENYKEVAQKLLINEYYFRYYLKMNEKDFEFLVGNFKIEKDSNIEKIVESLKNPIIEGEVNFIIFEGWNIYDIDDSLTQKGYIEKGEYIGYVTNQEKIEKLSEFFPFIKGLNTLEGFLYPDTYKINIDIFKINNLVIAQLENFENKVYNELLVDENGEQKYTNEKIEEIINLASIVEKEEKNSKEKPIVAEILKKRLNEGWMIGADITVCYPHELTQEECKLSLSQYIKERNEYNTRTKTGLPKTPISNPTYETINATINSKNTPYYFYLHDTNTGKIYYSTTNAEHEAKKRFVQ